MAEPGAVAFQFTRKGVIRATFAGDADEAMLAAIDAGAEDAEVDEAELQIYTEAKKLAEVRDALAGAGLTVTESELSFVPNNTVEITDPEVARKAENLMDALDSLDDVVATHTNFEIHE
jgi:transcriptional/translational regulatory protein YebC/TACO1